MYLINPKKLPKKTENNPKGAGRKTKAEELGLAKILADCVTPAEENEMWKAIVKEAKKGSIPHAQLYFNYKYGKPTETVKQTNDGELTIVVKRV